jgi:quinol monooxygenase YgiN
MEKTSEIQRIVRLKIHKGKFKEFKRLAAKCLEITRTKDKGTLQYEWYLNSGNTECLVIERYRNSEAFLEHHDHLRDAVIAILQTCSSSGELCGKTSPKLTKLMTFKGSPFQIYSPFQSI